MLASALISGCALSIAVIAWIVRRARKSSYEPMEFQEPVRTQIWADHIVKGEQE